MHVSLHRNAKYFCTQQQEIEKVLCELGAVYTATEDQVDYIYHIFDPGTETNSKRIKLRVVNEEKFLIFIYRRTEQEASIDYDYFAFADQQVVALINSLYKVSVTVKKRRKIFVKDLLIFHLDTISGVGEIFEVESLDSTSDTAAEILKFLTGLSNYLLEPIQVSNEDLVLSESDWS